MEELYGLNPLYENLLTKALIKHTVRVEFVGLESDAAKIVEQESYKVLRSIDLIIRDTALTDTEKCRKISTLLLFLGTDFDQVE